MPFVLSKRTASRVRDAHVCHRPPAVPAAVHMVDRDPSANQAGGQSEWKTVPEHDGPSAAVRALSEESECPVALAVKASLFHRDRFQTHSVCEFTLSDSIQGRKGCAGTTTGQRLFSTDLSRIPAVPYRVEEVDFPDQRVERIFLHFGNLVTGAALSTIRFTRSLANPQPRRP